MKKFTYRVIPSTALQTYVENGMEPDFDETALNGTLIVEAEDEETAEKFRKTYTAIDMWEKVED